MTREANAKPPRARAATSIKYDVAKADAKAESTYKKAIIMSTFFRPSASLKGPIIVVPTNAESVGAATTNPDSIGVKLNSVDTAPMTPEMTEASKPKTKPPRETIMAQ